MQKLRDNRLYRERDSPAFRRLVRSRLLDSDKLISVPSNPRQQPKSLLEPHFIDFIGDVGKKAMILLTIDSRKSGCVK
jgi:hypothetical protein